MKAGFHSAFLHIQSVTDLPVSLSEESVVELSSDERECMDLLTNFWTLSAFLEVSASRLTAFMHCPDIVSVRSFIFFMEITPNRFPAIAVTNKTNSRPIILIPILNLILFIIRTVYLRPMWEWNDRNVMDWWKNVKNWRKTVDKCKIMYYYIQAVRWQRITNTG